MNSKRSKQMRRDKNRVGIKITNAGAVATSERRPCEPIKHHRVVIQAIDAVFVDPHEEDILRGVNASGCVHLVGTQQRIRASVKRTATGLHLHVAPIVCTDEVEGRIAGLFHVVNPVDFIEQFTNIPLVVVPLGTIVGVRGHLLLTPEILILAVENVGMFGREVREVRRCRPPEHPGESPGVGCA